MRSASRSCSGFSRLFRVLELSQVAHDGLGHRQLGLGRPRSTRTNGREASVALTLENRECGADGSAAFGNTLKGYEADSLNPIIPTTRRMYRKGEDRLNFFIFAPTPTVPELDAVVQRQGNGRVPLTAVLGGNTLKTALSQAKKTIRSEKTSRPIFRGRDSCSRPRHPPAGKLESEYRG